ncbi:MAG TPA: hypothetical protein DCR87_00975 [Acidobacteria bacterium]|nr:hypothetical protein [Acidobacteriota bacterium]
MKQMIKIMIKRESHFSLLEFFHFPASLIPLPLPWQVNFSMKRRGKGKQILKRGHLQMSPLGAFQPRFYPIDYK